MDGIEGRKERFTIELGGGGSIERAYLEVEVNRTHLSSTAKEAQGHGKRDLSRRRGGRRPISPARGKTPGWAEGGRECL